MHGRFSFHNEISLFNVFHMTKEMATKKKTGEKLCFKLGHQIAKHFHFYHVNMRFMPHSFVRDSQLHMRMLCMCQHNSFTACCSLWLKTLGHFTPIMSLYFSEKWHWQWHWNYFYALLQTKFFEVYLPQKDWGGMMLNFKTHFQTTLFRC